MSHPRPAAVTILGLSGLVFGVLCVAWLALGRRHDLTDLLGAAFGDRSAAARLAQDHLVSVGALCAALVPLLLEWALAFILITAGVGLLYVHRSARWAALFYCACIIPLEGLATLLQVFCLTPPDQPVKLERIVVNGLVTLFAIVFWGGLFLPEVVATYAGRLSPPGKNAA
ncbi:MAG TPA: hypothetical protein VEL76_23715 [Gemmataceae bacterium]|nr:hypothetical protein [Gemmataceae bacterium]